MSRLQNYDEAEAETEHVRIINHSSGFFMSPLGLFITTFRFVVRILNVFEFFWSVFLVYATLFYHLFVPKTKRSIRGEVALVTGAGFGIGRQLGLRLASMGVIVVCVDIDEAKNEATRRMIEAKGGIAFAFTCDVSNRDQVEHLKRSVLEAVGDVNLLFNNAGMRKILPLNQYYDEEIEQIINVNLFGQIWLLRAFLPGMVKMNRGSVVSLSAIAGWGGFPNMLPWTASKFAVRGLMEGLYIELRQQKEHHKVHLMTVAPFNVESEDKHTVAGPFIGIPGLLNVVTAEKAAKIIVSSMQRGETVIFIPRIYYYVASWMRVLPLRVQLLLTDFIDTGLAIEYDTHHYEEDVENERRKEQRYQDWLEKRLQSKASSSTLCSEDVS